MVSKLSNFSWQCPFRVSAVGDLQPKQEYSRNETVVTVCKIQL